MLKCLQLGEYFGHNFNIPVKLVREFQLFLCHGIEMILVHKNNPCLIGSEIKLTLLYQNNGEKRQFIKVFIIVTATHSQ